jgi:putative ABC transport system permease protein
VTTLARQMARAHLPGYLAVLTVVAGGAAVTSSVLTALLATTGGPGPDRAPRVDVPAPDDLREMASVLLGTSLGVAAFTSCFLAASTMVFALDARQEETGLLRLLGATPRQVARLHRAEAALLGLAGGTLGAVAGLPGGLLTQAGLARAGLADPRVVVTSSWVAVLATVGGAVLTTVAGAWGPARRSGRTEPVRALALPGGARRTMTASRWVLGALGVGGACATVLVPAAGDEGGLLAVAISGSYLLVVGLTALAPLVVPAVARVIGVLAERCLPAAGMLARADVRRHARRTTALAAPLMLVVGLYAGFGTLSATARDVPRPPGVPVAGSLVVTGGAGSAAEQVAACASVTGVAACSATAALPGRWRAEDVTWSDIRVVDAGAAGVLGVEMATGAPADLRDSVVGTGAAEHVPGPVTYVDPSGREHHLTTGPVFQALDPYWAGGLVVSFDQLAAWGVPEPAAVEVWAALSPGGVATEVAPRLAAALDGAAVRTTEQWRADARAADEATNRNALVAVFGAAEVLTLVAVAVTCASSARERRGQLAVLRRGGARVRQVVGGALVEVVLVTAVAGVLVLAVQAFLVLRVGRLVPGVPVTTPWAELGALFGAAAVVALGTTAVATWRAALGRAAR